MSQQYLLKADKDGAWSLDFVRQFQNNPYNSDETKDRFLINSSNFIVRLGWVEFQNCRKLVSIGGELVLESDRTTDGIVLINGKFHDDSGCLFAEIIENEWRVKTSAVWDVEFLNANNLVVRAAQGSIILRMKITDNILEIRQCFFRKGDLRLRLKCNDTRSELLIEAGHTRFRSKDEKVVFQGPMGGVALRIGQ